MIVPSSAPVARSASFFGALALVGAAASEPPVWAADTESVVVAGEVAPTSLDALRWQRRLIVAFGDAPAEVETLERLVDENACRLDERDTDVYRVTSEAALPLSAGAVRLDDASRAALMELTRVPKTGRASDERTGDAPPGPFELVLIGKDGGVKRRAPAADALPDFLDAVDGMPMRRVEMARGAGNC